MKIIAAILISFIISAAMHAESIDGKVIAEKLNVRIFPGIGYSCVCTLNKGDTVKILGRSGEWFQIEAPQNAEVWVANSSIDGGEILKNTMFRAGPSVAYEFYFKSAGDFAFESCGEPERFWTRIKPSPDLNLKAWVSSKFVSIKKDDSALITDLPDSGGQPVMSVAHSQPSAPAKNSDGLNFIDGPSKNIATDGILMPLEKPESFITHSIDIKVNEELYVIAYAYSLSDNLKLWEKRKVRVRGKQRWVKDWKRPVIEIEKISPVWQ